MIENGQVWKHTVTGNEFIVLDSTPHETSELAASHPPDSSEEYVFVGAPDYETKETIWLARRLFNSQLFLVNEDSQLRCCSCV